MVDDSSRSPSSPAFRVRIPENSSTFKASRLQKILDGQLELRQLVRRYFETVHCESSLKFVAHEADVTDYGFLSFIHEPHYFRLLECDKAPRPVTALMIACTLR